MITWTELKSLITPHPLFGCGMETTRTNGVVDHKGEVFGYPGLYVADGAIVPRAIGLNPSRTIAALAERMAGLMVGNACGSCNGQSNGKTWLPKQTLTAAFSWMTEGRTGCTDRR